MTCYVHNFFGRERGTRLAKHKYSFLLFCVVVYYGECLSAAFRTGFRGGRGGGRGGGNRPMGNRGGGGMFEMQDGGGWN